MKQLYRVFAIAFLFLQINTAIAQTLTTSINGNKVDLNISLPGNISADFSLTFEQVIGLTESSLGISAELINLNDLSLLSRLPTSLDTIIPSEFPMMITIEPTYAGGLSFSDLVTVDIHTHNLNYTADTPLRLFKAPIGGDFRDITDSTSSGSYRARGSTGKFSQFIIVADTRSHLTNSQIKLTHLSNNLSAWQSLIDPIVYNQLSTKLGEITTEFSSANYVTVNSKISEFINLINQSTSSNIPNIWRSSRDLDNVAGELVADANTLRYSVRLINL